MEWELDEMPHKRNIWDHLFSAVMAILGLYFEDE